MILKRIYLKGIKRNVKKEGKGKEVAQQSASRTLKEVLTQ